MRLFAALIALCAFGTLVGIGLGFLGSIHPAFDTFSHFRFHFAFCLLIAFIVLAIGGFRKMAFLSLLVAVFAGWTSLNGTILLSNKQVPFDDKKVYSLLHLNLLWNHPEMSATVDWLIERDADLMSLSEGAVGWEPHLTRLEQRWPFSLHCPEFGKRGGVRVYSKWLMDSSTDYCGVYGSLAKLPKNECHEGQASLAFEI